LTCSKIFVTSGISFFVGILFLNVGRLSTDFQNYQSHFGALTVLLMMVLAVSALPAFMAFPHERPVFLREYCTRHYSILSYFIARTVNELLNTLLQTIQVMLLTYWSIGLQMRFVYLFLLLYALSLSSSAISVFVGAAVAEPNVAYQMLPVTFVPQIMLSGFFVRNDLVPLPLRFIQYFCPLMYAVRIGVLAEFKDCNHFVCTLLVPPLNAKEEDVWFYWLALILLCVIFRLAGLFVLKRKATRFL